MASLELTSSFHSNLQSGFASRSSRNLMKMKTHALNKTVPPLALEKVGAFGVSISGKDRLQYRDTSDYQNHLVQTYEDVLPLDDELKSLPRVEITLQKKIKKREMLTQSQKVNSLTSSDRQVIEELRQNLRTQPSHHAGTTSVLEAIADPKIRETRLYYEPLHKILGPGSTKKRFKLGSFKANEIKPGKKEHHLNLSRVLGKPSDMNLINVHSSHQHFNTPITSLSNVIQLEHYKKLRSNTSGSTYTTLPRVLNHHLRSEGHGSDKQTSKKKLHYSLSPSNDSKPDELTEGTNKTQILLPSIKLKVKEAKNLTAIESSKENKQKSTQSTNRHKPSTTMGTRFNERPWTKQNPAVPNKVDTTQLKETVKSKKSRANKRRNNIKTTATGKSHLIGPMNKMDMIVEYSKLLQSGVIDYNQYIKKLTVLSLHKIDLANSGLRQYHIVRDQNTGMKARLARVDIYPHHKRDMATNTQQGGDNSYSAENSNTRIGYNSTRMSHPQLTNKDGSIRVSRISIGEGVADHYIGSADHRDEMDRIYDAINTGADLMFGDLVRTGTNVERYRHAHRPIDRHSYNWSHIPHTVGGSRRLTTHHSVRAHTQTVREIHTDYGDKIPESREMKKRLNFSYPSYDVVVDGKKADGLVKEKLPIQQNEQIDTARLSDPDYLAITLATPKSYDVVPSDQSRQAGSSLSIHEVTMPQEMSAMSQVGRSPRRYFNNNSLTRNSNESKIRDASTSPIKENFKTLNIGTKKDSSYPSTNDDFSTSGTDGVLQSHLSRIFMNLSKANRKNNLQQPMVLVKNKTINDKPNTGSINPALGNLIVSRKIPPETEDNTTTSRQILPLKNNVPLGDSTKNIENQEKAEAESTKSNGRRQSTKSSALLSVNSYIPPNSPPPTAHIIQARDDDVTSPGSDDMSVFSSSNFIKVNITSGSNNAFGDIINENKIHFTTPSKTNPGNEDSEHSSSAKEKKKLEVVIATLPIASPGSEADSNELTD